MEQYNSIQQLLKKEGGEKNPVFPPTVIQAVFDAKTGASLEAILAQFNSVYLQYQGSPKATRLIIPKEMRRAGLTITYMNMEGETITERASSAVQKDNDNWGLEINWSRVDELSLSGDISVSAKGTWIINGHDTGVKAVGPKGEAGITPWLKTIDNRLHLSYDNVTWEPCSDPIAAYFRWSSNKIQISRDNKTWTDLSGTFADNLYIKGYVATTSALPSSAAQGDIYGVGPTYATEDTDRTNPIYRYYVRNAGTWVDNGSFTSIAAGIVQETGDSENVVMSQKAVTEKLSELGQKVDVVDIEVFKEYTNTFLQLNDYEIGDTLPQPTDNPNIRNYTIDCEEGDNFYIRYYSGSSSPKYGFVDETNQLLEKGSTESSYVDLWVKAPASAKKLLVFLAHENYEGQVVSKVNKLTLSLKKQIETATQDIQDIVIDKDVLSYPLGFLNMSSYKIGDILPPIGTSTITRCAEFECKEGDWFSFNAYAGQSWPYWVFIDDERRITGIDGVSGGWKKDVTVAPKGTTKFIITFGAPENYIGQYVYKYGDSINSLFNAIYKKYLTIEDLTKVEKIKELDKKCLKIDSYSVIESYSEYEITGQYIGDDLTVLPNVACSLTGYIECSEGDAFVYKGKGVGMAVVGYSDNQGNGAVGLLEADLLEDEKIIIIPNGINYVRAWSRNESHSTTPYNLTFNKVEYTEGNAKSYIENVVNEMYINYKPSTEETFSVEVNSINPYNHNQFDKIIPSNTANSIKYNHVCYFKLPKVINSACKLVISCPGGGITAKNWYGYMNHGNILNELGYAVLCITGYSSQWATDNGVSSPVPCGSWMATEEVLKAYQYIIDKYPFIDRTGCYIYGESQGGMVAENVAEETNIPIIATILDSPAISMQYAQMYISARASSVKALYGMENHVFDKNKCIGCDPFTRNTSDDVVMDETGALPTIDIDLITSKKYRANRTPVMIMTGDLDNIISTDVHLAYAKMLRNASHPTKVVNYEGVGHGTIQYSAVAGAIGGYSCTFGLIEVLDLLHRNGGYEWELDS